MRHLRKISAYFAELAPVRSVYAGALLEDFLVAAVAAVLAIRLYLHVTGYPQITVGDLHIAHVLFGGFLMLIALIILLAFVSRAAKEVAAVIGGAGFGTFIDELGKFVTRDNDYFFEPAIALIYLTFVLLFFLTRMIARRQALSEHECLAGALEIAEQASIAGIDARESRLAFGLLEECQQTGAVQNLRALLRQMAPARSTRRSPVSRTKALLDRAYEYAAGRWWFSGAIMSFFALFAITSLYGLVATVQWSWGLGLWIGGGLLILAALFWSWQVRARYVRFPVSAAIVLVSILITWAILGGLKERPLSLIDWAQLVFPGVSGVLVVIGLLLVPISRLRAYRMFQRAVLISILLTQVLAFYEYQFLAAAGLLGNILILVGLRYVVSNEEARLRGEQG